MVRTVEVEARIAGEKAVVRALVEHLGKFGWNAVEVNDGGEEPAIKVRVPVPRPSSRGLSADEVIEHAFAVDEAWVYFSNGPRKHWVFLVFGNSPEEVISDYSYAAESNPDDFYELMAQFDTEQVYRDWLNAKVAS